MTADELRAALAADNLGWVCTDGRVYIGDLSGAHQPGPEKSLWVSSAIESAATRGETATEFVAHIRAQVDQDAANA